MRPHALLRRFVRFSLSLGAPQPTSLASGYCGLPPRQGRRSRTGVGGYLLSADSVQPTYRPLMLPVYFRLSAMPYSITVTFSMSLSCSCSHAFAVFLAVSFHMPPSASRKVMPRSLIRMRKMPSGCSISWNVR